MARTRLSGEEYARVYRAVDEWTRERTLDAGKFSLMALQEFLGGYFGTGKPGRWKYQALAQRLVADMPDIQPMGGHAFAYARTGMARQRQTLASLVEFARGRVDRGKAAPKGRRTRREHEEITQRQLGDIERAAALAAEMVAGDRTVLDQVGAGHFEWLTMVGERDRGEWALVLKIGEHSDETARRRYQAAHDDALPWRREMNRQRRKKHEQGIRNLLDLAATHGLVSRGPEEWTAQVHAAEWEPDLARMRAEIAADSFMNPEREGGLRRLALYATRCGFRRAADTDWQLVIDAITDAHLSAERPLKYTRLAAARQVYNILLDLRQLQGPRWRHSRDSPITLIPLSVIGTAAEQRDCSAFRLPDGRYPEALCEGVFGLGPYISWVTATADELIRDTDLPPREWPRPTPTQRVRAAGNRRIFTLTHKSLRRRLEYVMRHAGFCARERGVDFTTAGLDALCDPAHLIAHKQARTPDRTASDNSMGALAQHLCVIASPFLEARSLQAAARARLRGEDEAVAEYLRKADALREHSGSLRALAVEYSAGTQARGGGRHGDGDAIAASRIQVIWEQWTADGRSGWHKLGILRDCLIGDIEALGARSAGRGSSARLSIQDQIDAIEALASGSASSGRFKRDAQWAVAVRDAVMVTVLQRVPLRAENVIGLTMTQWRSIAAAGTASSRPWDGAIQFEIPATEMKGRRPFSPPLLLAKDREDPEVVGMVRPDLLQLYFMSGGARDYLLRVPDAARRADPAAGEAVSSEYVFAPASAGRRPRGHRAGQRKKPETWGEHGATDRFIRALKQHSARLGIDYAALRRIHGATSLHVIRHLFGSHHCDPSRWPDAIGVEQASKMLHHGSIELTMQRYCGITERHVSIRTKTVPAPLTAAPVPALEQALVAKRLEADMDDYVAGRLDHAGYEERRARILRLAQGGER